MHLLILFAFILYHTYFAVSTIEGERPFLVVVTVATDKTDGLLRLLRSADAFGLNIEIYGLNEEWKGGDTRIEPGGAQKIRILRENLSKYSERSDVVLLFVDAYDVVFNGDEDEITKRFLTVFHDYRVVFSAEPFCWPIKDLEPKYPTIDKGYRFLNSGLFIGYAPEVWKILNAAPVKDTDDDQLYYTQIYLNKEFRKDLKIALDSTAVLFQNLNGLHDDVRLDFTEDGDAKIVNTAFASVPLILHGNGPSKKYLNHFGNYIGKAWSAENGCMFCGLRNRPSLIEIDENDWPFVTLAIFLTRPIPFVNEFLTSLSEIDYPKSHIDLYLYSNQHFNENDINEFLKKSKVQYRSVDYDTVTSELSEREARTTALKLATMSKSDFAFLIDADVQITNKDTLKILIDTSYQLNIGLIAPLVALNARLYSNFWGDISPSGYYERSDDYVEIVNRQRTGIWNVPYITSAILLNKDKITQMEKAFVYNLHADPDMSFCQFARDNGHFMYVDNQNYYGFLTFSDHFDMLNHLHPEMYQIFDNRKLWEERYIHPKYFAVLNGEEPIKEPCRDVFEFPLMSERFCKELIEEMEHYGQWSSGRNEDKRIVGGYENVPTRDIHMRQIDFEQNWLYMIDEYVRPIQEKVFEGYVHKPVESTMMFVVRYKPDEQASLRPHHDASTYSIDIALNKKGVDYKGGGVRFVRYNCTLEADEIGYSMIFPGRLTHLHEGLPTTEGTRYIAVSFLNP